MSLLRENEPVERFQLQDGHVEKIVFYFDIQSLRALFFIKSFRSINLGLLRSWRRGSCLVRNDGESPQGDSVVRHRTRPHHLRHEGRQSHRPHHQSRHAELPGSLGYIPLPYATRARRRTLPEATALPDSSWTPTKRFTCRCARAAPSRGRCTRGRWNGFRYNFSFEIIILGSRQGFKTLTPLKHHNIFVAFGYNLL